MVNAVAARVSFTPISVVSLLEVAWAAGFGVEAPKHGRPVASW
jgi:hypothetical protein